MIIKKLYFELTKKSRGFFEILRRFFQNYKSKIRNNKMFYQNYKVIMKKLYFELTKKSIRFFQYIEAFFLKIIQADRAFGTDYCLRFSFVILLS